MKNWSSSRPENPFECEVLDVLSACELPGVVIANVIIPRMDPSNSLYRLPDEHDILVFLDGHLYTLDMKELNQGYYRGHDSSSEFSRDGATWFPLPKPLWPRSTALKKVRVLESFFRSIFGSSMPSFVGGVVVPNTANVNSMSSEDGTLPNGARIILANLCNLEKILKNDFDNSSQRRPTAEKMAHLFQSVPEPIGSDLPCQVDEYLRLDQLLARRSHPVPHRIYRGYSDRLRKPVTVELLRSFEGDLSYTEAQRAYRNCLLALSELRHPSIPRYFPPVELHNALLIVCEYFSIETLQERAVESRMEWPQLRAIFSSLVEALIEAHKNEIVHRHVEPGCILVGQGSEPEIRLTGFFGAAIQDFSLVQDTSFSSPYRAPEYNDETRWRTPMEDAYSLGRCLCAALSGNPNVLPTSGAPPAVLALLPGLTHENPGSRSGAWGKILSALEHSRLLRRIPPL